MAKIILKAVLWGVVSWLVLSILLFFGVGFYQGFVSRDLSVEIPAFAVISLRYLVLLLSLGVASAIFILEEKKQKPFRHIVAEKEEIKKPSVLTPAPVPIMPKPGKKIEFHGTVMPKIEQKEVSGGADKKAPEIIWPDESPKESKIFEPSFKPSAPPTPSPFEPPEPKPQPPPIPPKPHMPPQPKPSVMTPLTPPTPTPPSPQPRTPGSQQQPPWNRT